MRLVLAALKDRDIAARTETSRDLLGDDEILSLLAKMIKQREESATAYDAGNRPELAAGEREEIAIIRSFMPAQMDEAAMKAAVAKADRRTGRHLDQGHGQGDGGAERALCRPDGFRQGQRRWSKTRFRRRNKAWTAQDFAALAQRYLRLDMPVDCPHALWRRIAGGNPAADRSGPAGGPARQADAQGPGDVGLLPLPRRKIAQLQGRE